MVEEGGQPLRLPAQKPRALLACLLVRANEAVPADRLVDELWGESPPASSAKVLQVYVSQLRRALGADAVETVAPGYRVRLGPEQLDADRFERLLAEGRGALAAGNAPLAASLLRRALGLWRGPALADAARAGVALPEAARLDDLRLACVEERIEADLALGRHEEVLPELRTLVSANPYRERLRGQLMLSLYRAGRQAEALDAFRDARRALLGDLGLEPGPELRRLQQAILDQDPALAPAGEASSGTPRPPSGLTPLVGRERDLGQLRALVARPEVRLVTLAGAGGSGKTRLARALAETCADDFANGAITVELGPIREPELVLPTLGRALDLAEHGDQPVEARLAARLGGSELLLVLDNFEHLTTAAPALVELARAAPRVTLVVTSRRVLHVSGEHVFPVRPLAEDDAVELFAQRAAAHGSEPAPDDAEIVREICRRVDGLPLAIELAAARMTMLRPAELLERLASRLTLLAGGPRDLPARQQTLRETLDWSYDLLSDNERRALQRLSVFRGGWTLDAADAVCGVDFDTAAALLDDSLVRRLGREGPPRYGFLQTIREYALERLAESGEEHLMRCLHADWYLDLAEAAEPHFTGEDQAEWFSTLDGEHDDLRAALDFLAQSDEPELLLRLTVALTRFWYVRGYLGEASHRLETALAAVDGHHGELRRRALTSAAALALIQGDYDVATRHAEQSLAAARLAGEPGRIANGLSNLGAIVLAAGDHERAGELLEEAVALAREAGDTRVAALAINNLGDHALTVGDFERAEPLFEESLELLRARGDTANIARALFNLGAVALQLGRLDDARVRFGESLAGAESAGDKEDLAWSLVGVAALAAAEGLGERAARLLGGADALLEEMSAELKPFERQLHERAAGEALALCGEDAFAAARREGSALSLSEAVALALAAPEPAR